MKIVVWGTRGSLAAPGPETVKYGGNTVCVEVRATGDHVLVLDAGSGIRRLGAALPPETRRIDVLLTHLHMDHLVGLGFFDALYRPDLEVHIWGPASTTQDLAARLTRYLSPPLFPVRIRDLACRLALHDVPLGTFSVPNFEIQSALVAHPGPTVGYRVTHADGVVTYLTDHEPALGVTDFPGVAEWTSGYDLAHGADVLIHDAQFDDDEYRDRQGWGHSSVAHALAFAELTEVGHLVAFHHDPTHDDEILDDLYAAARAMAFPFQLTVAHEGLEIRLPRGQHDGQGEVRREGTA
ncbi:MAG: MBL fold metallo-hydrolase [Acidimicrobiia bacterium]